MSDATQEIKSAAPEAARLLHLANSYISDASGLILQIKAAHEELDGQIKGGTAGGSLSAGRKTGSLTAQFERQLSLAIDAIDKANAIDPSADASTDLDEITAAFLKAKAYDVEGGLKCAIGSWPEAISAFKESLKYLPDQPSTLFNLGLAYTNTSDREAALEVLQKAVKIDPIGECGIDAAKLAAQIERGEVGYKQFRGSWKVMGSLLGVGVLFIFPHVWLIVFLCVAIAGLYFYLNFK